MGAAKVYKVVNDDYFPDVHLTGNIKNARRLPGSPYISDKCKFLKLFCLFPRVMGG